MVYNFLTINGITKICDDKYYYHNGSLTNLQWYNFQLQFVLNVLKLRLPIPKIQKVSGEEEKKSDEYIVDPYTSYKYTRSYIYRIIINSEYFENGQLILPQSVSEVDLRKHGMIKINNNRNIFTIGHIGGLPKNIDGTGFKLELDEKTFDLIKIPNNYE